jgi:ABC-type sugar transport system substrate-binding protein
MKKTALSLLVLLGAFSANALHAQDTAALKGKTIAFVPTSLGYDLTDGWHAMVRRQVEPLGMKMVIRDPNWSTDAGAQAITSLISEKPDVLMVQNPDIQSYARLLKRAQDAGIHVIQVNMRSSYASDAFVGADYVALGETMANAVWAQCGAGKGKSGKVAIVQGVLTAAASAYQMKGVNNVFSKHPEIKVVSNQAADWDASKARSVTDTILKQHPDLCGVIGFWDGMDVGTGAAIREAKKQGAVFMITSGGMEKAACNNIANGTYTAYVGYDIRRQADDIVKTTKDLIVRKAKAGQASANLFTPLTVLTKQNMRPDSCWDIAEYKKK